MGLSIDTTTYTGGPQTFPISFALGFADRDDVVVFVVGDLDGAGEQLYRDFTWNSDSEIVVTAPLTVGDEVTRMRTVSKTVLVADYTAPGSATRANLQATATQSMMALHEVLDGRILESYDGLHTIQDFIERAGEDADRAEAAAEGYSNFIADSTTNAAVAKAAADAVLDWSNYKARTTEPFHAQFKYEKDGIWTSPDPIVMAMAGQSNAVGNSAATDGPKTGTGDVWVWNGYITGSKVSPTLVSGTAWVQATLGQVPFNTASGTVNNAAFHAAHKLSVDAGRPVYLILSALGGTSIAQWSDGGACYDLMDQNNTDAMASLMLWGDEQINLFGFGQGENEYDLTTALYTLGDTKYPALIDAVRAETWAADDMAFLATLPVQEADGGQAWQVSHEWAKVAAGGKVANFAVVPTNGLTLTGADVGLQVHFNGASLAEIGYRMADIYSGKSAGITSNAGFPRGTAGYVSYLGEPHVKVADCWFSASTADPDTVQLVTNNAGVSVLYVAEVAGVSTRTGGLTAGGTPNVSYTVNNASPVRLSVYVNAAFAFTNLFKVNIAAGEPAGSGNLLSLWLNPDVQMEQIYATGHSGLGGQVIAKSFARSMTTLRLQTAPLLDWSQFVAADLPRGLTLLNLAGCNVPAYVQHAIAAENIRRGGTITVTNAGNTSAGRVSHFATVTDMTTAITNGFTAPNDAIATVGSGDTNLFSVLRAKAGAAAVSGVAPAGWVLQDFSGARIEALETGVVSPYTFTTRAALVSWWATNGAALPDGAIVSDGTVSYIKTAGATSVTDIIGVLPYGADALPDHYATPGTTNMQAALVSWAAGYVGRGTHAAVANKLYASTAFTTALNFAAGGVFDWKGSTFQQAWTLDGNTVIANVNAGATVKNMNWTVTGANYFQRGAYLYADAKLENVKFAAATPMLFTDDTRDAVFMIRGPRVKINGLTVDGAMSAVRTYNNGTSGDTDVADCEIRNVHLYNMMSGINLRGDAFHRGIVDGVYVYSLHPNGAPDPGQNVITEGAPYATVRRVKQMFEGKGSWEHFIYSGVTDGTTGMTFDDIQSNGAGQCFVKLRGHKGFTATTLHGAQPGYGSAVTANKDGLRFEYCREGVVSDCSIRSGTSAKAGFNTIHLNNSWDIAFSGIYSEEPGEASLFATTPPPTATYSQSPNLAVEGITIDGWRIVGAGTKPFFKVGAYDTETDVKIGNVTVTNLDWDGDLANLFTIGAGMTLTQVAGTAIRISGRCNGVAFDYIQKAGELASLIEISTPTQGTRVFSTGGSERLRLLSTGVQITGLLSGTAVTQTAYDNTTGRVLKTGDGGVLGYARGFGSGEYWGSALSSQMISGPAIASQPVDKPNSNPFVGWHIMSGSTRWGEIVQETSGSSPWRIWARTSNSGTTLDWDLLFTRKSVLGAVSQTAGVPTGALIERGSSTNGEYARFADGTQICTRTVTATALAIGTAMLGGFRSAGVSWTFPATFIAAPVLSGAGLAQTTLTPTFDAPTASAVNWNAIAFTSQAAADRTVTLTAIGRWF